MMVESILGNIKMIKKTDIEFLNGQKEKNIEDLGKMGDRMEKEKYMILKIKNG